MEIVVKRVFFFIKQYNCAVLVWSALDGVIMLLAHLSKQRKRKCGGKKEKRKRVASHMGRLSERHSDKFSC